MKFNGLGIDKIMFNEQEISALMFNGVDVLHPVYGINHQHSIDYITRTGNAAGMVANAGLEVQNDFNNIMPWAGMKRCNLADNLTVNAYYGDAGYVEDGSNGQVMVEVPAFWYRQTQVDADNRKIEISAKARTGFKLHPWFYDAAGNPVTQKYIGAFEASIYDVSASQYILDDAQVANFTVGTGDKLCSIAGAKPCSGLTQNLTLPNTRILANNREAGWQQQYFTAISAIQMLFMVEYASFNSQSKIGQGITGKANGTGNEANNTGATSFLGNKSGRQAGTDNLCAVSYRGIENLWGNIWNWVDGINIDNGVPYISNVNGNFVSDVFAGQYVSAGATLKNANGYFSKAILTEQLDYGFLPADAVVTSNSYYADYYYQNPAGWFVARLGGRWNDGSYAGAFYWALNYGSGDGDRGIGARLCV